MMTDTIADMLTRIRNAQKAGKRSTEVPYSKVKFAIANILKAEGYIEQVETVEQKPVSSLVLGLKYHGKQPAIQHIKRESTPGHRMYKATEELPKVLNGYGTAIVSTSQGMMTVNEAKKRGIGGELICTIY